MKDLSIIQSMDKRGLTAHERNKLTSINNKRKNSMIGKAMSSIPYAREVYYAIKMIDNLISVN